MWPSQQIPRSSMLAIIKFVLMRYRILTLINALGFSFCPRKLHHARVSFLKTIGTKEEFGKPASEHQAQHPHQFSGRNGADSHFAYNRAALSSIGGRGSFWRPGSGLAVRGYFEFFDFGIGKATAN